MTDLNTSGYIKIHRVFLTSKIHSLGAPARACFLDILLLLDRKTGSFITNISELAELTKLDRKTLRKVLEMLSKSNAIRIIRKDANNIQIVVPNWLRYQKKYAEKEIAEGGEKSSAAWGKIPRGWGIIPTYWGKIPTLVGKNPHPLDFLHNSVPVILNVEEVKEVKNILRKEGADKPRGKKSFSESKLFLNLIDPKTDLEKLIAFYLKGVGNPAFKKPDANQILNKAISNDIPHYEAILNQTESLKQAQDIVAEYVTETKGNFSVYYLSRQIDSRRQMWEEKHRRKYGKV